MGFFRGKEDCRLVVRFGLVFVFAFLFALTKW